MIFEGDFMAHYAFLDENYVVVDVITGVDEPPDDWEAIYSSKRGGMMCKKTSYNTSGGKHRLGGIPFRKNYAGIGYTYDPTRDAFIPPQLFPSWILDEETCQWEPPVPPPQNEPEGGMYIWNEDSLSWVLTSR